MKRPASENKKPTKKRSSKKYRVFYVRFLNLVSIYLVKDYFLLSLTQVRRCVFYKLNLGSMKKQSITAVLFVTAMLAVAKAQSDTGPVSIEELMAPAVTFSDVTCKAPKNLHFSNESTLKISGMLEGSKSTIVLHPENSAWNASEYSFFRVDLKNTGQGLVWIQGRLDNPGAKEWVNSTSSEVFIMPGETATLGFPFPRAKELDDAPKIFASQDTKPNGHRNHWKAFDPANITACRLQIQSTSDILSLEEIKVSLAQPYGAEANAELLKLPYLDPFGQVRNLDWPEKLEHADQLLQRNQVDQKKLTADPGPPTFDHFGGWMMGPKLESTGFFRTEKVNGKWWIVDPEGKLFFSHGANSIGFAQRTPIDGRQELFEWLPEYSKKQKNAHFIQTNLTRTFGEDWQEPAADRLHRRLRSWGINTLGAWTDTDLTDDHRTPYTSILHLGGKWNALGPGISDPYAPEFQTNLEKNLVKLNVSTDPWCVGVFIDNEIHWTDLFVRNGFKKDRLPARKAFLERLQSNYPTIGELNAAWETDYADWDSIKEIPAPEVSKQTDADMLELRTMLAGAYYKACSDAMHNALPNHLYLGSRMHNTPDEIVAVACKYVDVLSLNSYAMIAGARIPEGFDKPCLNSEFHFGAVDRGVPGPGLRSVANQRQRSRAYTAYVVAGLLHPNIVGTHWFAYSDQSAAGRPGENYQVGFVDVTDTPYPEITTACRKLADNMYSIGVKNDDLLTVLETLWSKPQNLVGASQFGSK